MWKSIKAEKEEGGTFLPGARAVYSSTAASPGHPAAREAYFQAGPDRLPPSIGFLWTWQSPTHSPGSSYPDRPPRPPTHFLLGATTVGFGFPHPLLLFPAPSLPQATSLVATVGLAPQRVPNSHGRACVWPEPQASHPTFPGTSASSGLCVPSSSPPPGHLWSPPPSPCQRLRRGLLNSSALC